MKDEEKISIPTSKRLKALGFGNFMVCLFLVLFFVFIYFSIRIFMGKGLWIGLLATLGMVVVEILIFFTGIITIYLTSVQTKLWLKVLGIVVGWAPGLNLIALGLIEGKRMGKIGVVATFGAVCSKVNKIVSHGFEPLFYLFFQLVTGVVACKSYCLVHYSIVFT